MTMVAFGAPPFITSLRHDSFFQIRRSSHQIVRILPITQVCALPAEAMRQKSRLATWLRAISISVRLECSYQYFSWVCYWVVSIGISRLGANILRLRMV